MGQALCPVDAPVLEKNESSHSPEEISSVGSTEIRRKEALTAAPASWDPADAKACDAELLVLATIKAFKPESLKRYLSRRQQLATTGDRCFEYESREDGGFCITVPSHALTIDSAVESWKSTIEKEGLPEQSVVKVRVIEGSKLAKVEAGDG